VGGAEVNAGGRTVFLEEDAAWIASVRARHPRLESHHVAYDTVLTDADALLELRRHPPCVAQPDLAAARAPAGEVEWDLVMVDAAVARSDERRRPTDVVVHDVNRFSKAFLCEGYLVEQVGRIRHFVIPSHRSDKQDAMPFCPSQDA
jgi:glucuronoxylan 4-O-methyltransferase